MTPIQAHSLPPILDGKDVIAQGKTGTGKTAAFSLGILQKLNAKTFRVQSLVLCPTRELADQVATEIRKLARAIDNVKVLTLCGGTPLGPQAGSLEHGAHIVVGTPGRVEDHLSRGTLILDEITTLVLDEADRMLEMGFQETLDRIIDQTPKSRQTLLFSATFPTQIQSISNRVMNDPLMVKVASTHSDNSIKQHFYKVSDDQHRLKALQLLMLAHLPESTLIFCNTKKQVQEVADGLADLGFSVAALHGDLEQRERDQTLVRFANKSVSILVATDVAARGLDIDALDAVINCYIAHDAEVHTHRIGRTGRAGNQGFSCSLFSEQEAYRVALLDTDSDPLLDHEPLPDSSALKNKPMKPKMVTLQIDGGRKQKLRPGDILGALTGENGIEGKQVGKIQIFDNWAYVAVATGAVSKAQDKINQGKLKGRSFRARQIRH